jgi:GxxExxY protein
MGEEQRDPLTEQVIGAAIEVHRVLGPGLLESVYEQCLCQELALAGIDCRRQVELPVVYKGTRLDTHFNMDLVVPGRLIVELKAVEKLLPIHEAQLLTYLKLSGIRLGLLLNFNVRLLKEGIKRLIL